ncbi:MAG: DUF6519 domain-containing protein [Halieaceae bacterium]|jgi:hypothetical protein|nr:DUF6519 domain-containing protein [Halieaceae bacterium]
MKTDLTRNTFDPSRHYSSVRTKQGSMQLDADWNEQVDILARREELALVDIIGSSGRPQHGGGFRVLASAADLTAGEAADPVNASPPAAGPGDVLITGGRAYVEGHLIENDGIVTLSSQPDLPGAGPLASPGLHALYLDVWERTITSLEDPAIREIALGGPDSATRTQRIWQVRSVAVGNSGDAGSCLTPFAALEDATAPSTGRLAARAEPDPAATGPCVIPESAGYRSLENQLYRVECIRAGTRATARFVWSRDNGSVISSWVSQNGPELTVSSPGPDALRGFSNGDWIELIDRGRELRGEAGTLVRILAVRGDVLEIDPATADGPTTLASFPEQPRIRRWDSDGVFAADGANWVALEQGVEVRFSAGSFAVGDYWTIPARTNSGSVEWPESAGAPVARLAEGIRHVHARLAMVDVAADGTLSVENCLPEFPPLTALLQLDYVGGDGQEVMPDPSAAGVELPEPLQVAVSRGSTPVAGVPVRFSVVSGGGRVAAGAETVVLTDALGVAAVSWRLGNVDEAQRVEARLLDADGDPRHVPLRFSANFSIAAEVAFDPSNCERLSDARTVQEAIDILCKSSGASEPGFRIQRMFWEGSERAYQHDGPAAIKDIASGLRIVCDAAVDPETVVNRPVIFVTALLPDNSGFLQQRRIDAELRVKDKEIFWRPNPNAVGMIEEFGESLAPLELTIRGDNIRALGDDERERRLLWLDADALERPGREILPTGDERRGGTFVSWFRAVRDEAGFGLRFVDVARIDGGALTGRLVSEPGGEALDDVQVFIADRDISATTDGQGIFFFEQVPVAAFVITATARDVTESFAVNALARNPGTFTAADFRGVELAQIEGLSPTMLTRLERAGLGEPFVIANLNERELVERLGIADRTARNLLRVVRAAGRQRRG